ncbi:FAD dependent oxidoreductase [Favolaschia claudopus]|uniref:FAD dependent oxidoreductase n=1 Tax=Favolaschia claudopus TaxID=2862362 RepID=A0AAW0BG76_9AGAR
MSISTTVPLFQFPASTQAFNQTAAKPASLPVPNPTRSFWIDSTPDANPLAAEGSEGPFTEDADICIVGSGITGVSAAYHIARCVERGEIPRTDNDKALRVVILEARDFWHLTPLVFIDFTSYQEKYGQEQAVRCLNLETHTASEIVKLIRQEGWSEAVDLVENGHTTLFFTPEEYDAVKADFVAAQEAGLDVSSVRWLSKEDTKDKYGAAYPAVEFGGHNLWPLKFVTQLYLLAKNKTSSQFNLKLHTRTPVTSISLSSKSSISSSSSSRRWAVTTPRGTLDCSHIIHATNAYASHLLPHLSGPAGIVPARGQVVALRANVVADKMFKCSWDGNQGFEYWFPRPVELQGAADLNDKSDENLKENLKKPLVILGGGREVEGSGFEFGETDDSVLNVEVGKMLRGFLPAVFPGKFDAGQEPEMEWTGIMGFTKLGDPFVRRL